VRLGDSFDSGTRGPCRPVLSNRCFGQIKYWQCTQRILAIPRLRVITSTDDYYIRSAGKWFAAT
jgi:hypothetical protein